MSRMLIGHGGSQRLRRGLTCVRCHRQAHHHHITAPLTVDNGGLEDGSSDRRFVGSNLQTSEIIVGKAVTACFHHCCHQWSPKVNYE